MKEVFKKIEKELENLFLGDDEERSCTIYETWNNHAISLALGTVNNILEEYKDKYVSVEAYKQVMWERDMALTQLEELGYGFGEKIWIQCDEELPSSDGRFEVTIKGKNGKRYVEMCNFHKDAKSTPWGIENWSHGNVIAWRKRPKPYKERKGNNYETKN